MESGRWKRAIGLSLCCCLFAIGPVDAQEIRETILPNGLKVLTKEIHAAPVVSVWTYYRVGSRNEGPGITGISHQIEHMMFKGTSTLKPGDIDRLTALAGGKNNAFTDTDCTAYYFAFPSDAAAPPGHYGLETALRIEADRMTNCAMDPGELAHEKEVVLSELSGDENNPFNRLDQSVKAAAFMAHPYQWPTIGWRNDVQAFTRDAVLRFYRTYYVPNNATLVIVGDFETDRVLARVRELFGPIAACPEPPKVITQEPPQQGERRMSIKGESSAAYFIALYHIPQTTHADMYALGVLDSLLTVGKSSRLHRAIVNGGMAVGVTSELSQKIDPGWETVYVTCPGNVDRAKFERVFDEAVLDLQRRLVDDEELAKGKRLSETQVIFAMDSVSDQGSLLGAYELAAGWRYLLSLVPRTAQVTAEQVREAAKRYLTADNRTIGWFLPTKISAEKPVPAGKPGPIHRQISPVRYPNAEGTIRSKNQKLRRNQRVFPQLGFQASALRPSNRVVMSNGMTLILQPNKANPTVAVSGFVDAGGIFDPPQKPGLANFVAQMLDRGTATRSATKFQNQIDMLGAELDFNGAMDAMTFDGKCLSRDLPKLLELLHDALTRPAFDTREFAQVRAEQRTSLQEDEDSPYLAAMMDLKEVIYPQGHPERHYVRGTEASLRAIGRGDLVKFYRKHYRPDATSMVLVGDFDAIAVQQQIESLFGAWRGDGPKPRLELPPPVEIDPAVARVPLRLPLGDKAEAIVVMGSRGVDIHAPDYFAALVANHILGGGELLNSRLLTALRERRGLTYSVSTSFLSSRGERLWTLVMQNNPQKVGAATAAALAELQRTRTQPPTQDELEQARAMLIGGLLLGMETGSGIAQTVRDMELYQLDPGWIGKAVEAIKRVTREEVLAAAKKYLPAPEKMITVIAGPER